MQRYFIYLSYDGTHYHGWQVQPNGVSVQSTIEQALSTVLRCATPIVGAGRTDAGVHAAQMVAHFDSNQPINPSQLTDKLNRLVPPDIAIHRICAVAPEAHARFSATARTYHYHIVTQKSPFSRHYAYRFMGKEFDVEAMNAAAAHLLQYTDFTSFSKVHTDVKTNNCRITEAHWERVGAEWVFVITADRFLRNMVRAIVGTLLEVGRGKLSVAQFCQIIEQKNRCAAGTSMPGNALFLVDIAYPEALFLS